MAVTFDAWNMPQEPAPSPAASQKKPRHRHAPHQLAALNELFDQNEHPPLEQRTALAERLGMETKTVNAWFQNKRASSKKRTKTAPGSDGQPSGHSRGRADEEDDYDGRHPRSAPVILSDVQPPLFSADGDPPHFSAEAESASRNKTRFRLSDGQIEELRRLYSMNPNPSAEQRQELAGLLGMRYQSITNWFQNQRSLAKKRKEDDRDLAQSDYSPHELRPFAAFPSPLPPVSSHPSLPALSRPRRSPSVSLDEATVRRNALHQSSAPYPTPASPSFSRPRRSRPEPYQLDALKRLFNKTPTPTIEERSALALEIGMDVGKVTNWFRNLRQTARKRAKKSDSDDDDDTHDPFSAAGSRAGSPSLPSSSSSVVNESMDMDVEEFEIQMHRAHSDLPSEEDDQEAVTPSPERSPEPPVPSTSRAPYESSSSSTTRVIEEMYRLTESDKASIHQFSGIRVEDALLLLSFHQHIVH